ncbi:Double-strand break repair protein MRE11 [Platanthera guangdongensis]|uniref:Double-strand break repair protein MRE11 n=1 Tax=Platanthera guangdongensis TaxID=2320717 RepID=A0ABR2MZ16_9ASPA
MELRASAKKDCEALLPSCYGLTSEVEMTMTEILQSRDRGCLSEVSLEERTTKILHSKKWKMEILPVNDLDIALHDFVNKDDKMAFYSCLQYNLQETKNKLNSEADSLKFEEEELILKVSECLQALTLPYCPCLCSASTAVHSMVDEDVDSPSSEETEKYEVNEAVENSEPEENFQGKSRKRAAPRGRGRGASSTSKRGRKGLLHCSSSSAATHDIRPRFHQSYLSAPLHATASSSHQAYPDCAFVCRSRNPRFLCRRRDFRIRMHRPAPDDPFRRTMLISRLLSSFLPPHVPLRSSGMTPPGFFSNTSSLDIVTWIFPHMTTKATPQPMSQSTTHLDAIDSASHPF